MDIIYNFLSTIKFEYWWWVIPLLLIILYLIHESNSIINQRKIKTYYHIKPDGNIETQGTLTIHLLKKDTPEFIELTLDDVRVIENCGIIVLDVIVDD